MTMPGRTPTNATPRAHVTARANSRLADAIQATQLGDVEQAERRRDDDRGKDRLGHRLDEPRRHEEHQENEARGDQPGGWVLAPDWSATAVREPLVLTGNPEKSPAARLADPIPASSWLPLTS